MNSEPIMREPTSEPDLLAAWLHSATSSGEPDAGGTFTSTVDGVLQRATRENLWIRGYAASDDDARSHDVGVAHDLPSEIDLKPLVGQAVRATMVCEEGMGDRQGLTLVLSSPAGRVWLIARSGTVQGVTHAVSSGCGQPSLHAALSQRPLGPLVIGTSELQWLVPIGRSAVLRMPDGSVFRALLVDRRQDGTASYVIADETLFATRLS